MRSAVSCAVLLGLLVCVSAVKLDRETVTESVVANGNTAPKEWDTDDGGTAVILSNDNSVSQTWDDREGRKLLMEAHKKQRSERSKKHSMEESHKKKNEELGKKAEKDRSKAVAGSEAKAKKETAKMLDKTEKMMETRRQKMQEEDEKTEKKQRAELEIRKSKAEAEEKEAEKKATAAAQRIAYTTILKSITTPRRNKVVVADSGNLKGYEGYSLMFWVKPTGKHSHWTNLFARGSYSSKRSPSIFFYPGRTRLHIRSSTATYWNDGLDPSEDLALNQWVHVALVHKKGEMRVYYDGDQAASRSNIQSPGGDYFTKTSSGCTCYFDRSKTDCACCHRGGAQCDAKHKQFCVRSGAGSHCKSSIYISDPWHTSSSAQIADVRHYAVALEASEVKSVHTDTFRVYHS